LKLSLSNTIIKVDIDKKNLPNYTLEGLEYLSKYYSIQKLIIRKSQNNNYHIIIGLKEKLTDLEIIVIQFCLGSDKRRERLNYIRHLNGGKMEDWNLLFVKKTKIPKTSITLAMRYRQLSALK